VITSDNASTKSPIPNADYVDLHQNTLPNKT
jgi:hypothetical protein